MDNVHVTKKYGGITMAAVLIFGAVAAGLIVAPQTAYAAVTMEASAETFYGTAFVRVLITDTAQDDDNDTITPTVEARDGSTVLGSVNPTIESIGTSGTFELYITTSGNDLVPSNPSYTDTPASATVGTENGPVVVRIGTGASAADSDGASATVVDANGVDVTTGANNFAIVTAAALEAGDSVRINYGGQQLNIDFEDVAASLTADRTEAGTDNEIVLALDDQDANTDPTLVDEFVFAAPTDLLTSTNAITYGDATWTETGQNTGIFEQTITVGTAGTNDLSPTLPTGNSFTADDHSVYEDLAQATAPFDVVTQESTTSSASVTLRNRDGAISLSADANFANGLMVQVTDADRNISTTEEDDIAAAVVVVTLEGSAETLDGVVFTETDDNTGVFMADLNDDKLPISLAAALDLDADVVVLTTAFIADGDDITVTYNDPASADNVATDDFEVITTFQTQIGELTSEMETSSITDDVTLTLEDSDLNTDPDTIQTYDASAGLFTIAGITVGEFTVTAIDTVVVDPAGADLADIEATFIETGANTGIFVADDIDMGEINDAEALEDGEEVEFEYNDVLEDPAEDSDVTINIGIPDEGIDVDRNTVPLPVDGDPVTITLTVVDPVSNEISGSTETVTIDGVGAGIQIFAENGDGDDVDVDDFTSIVADITLTETGPNTGIFEEDVDLEAGPGVSIDDLRDAKITFEFGDESVTITYRAYDGSITVTPAAIKSGEEFTVTVTDQDENRDPEEVESFDIDFEAVDDDTDAGTITVEETGENTGVFEEVVEAGEDITIADVAAEEFATAIEFTYVDEITSDGSEDEDRESTVHIVTSSGQVTIDPENPGPGTEVIVTIIDDDLNENPNGVDEIDAADDIVEISSSDGDDGSLGFEETGPNTGIFEATLQLAPRDADADGELTGAGDDFEYTVLPGDVLAIRYTDTTNTGGNEVLASVTFEVISEDPEMEVVSPTVQIGGTIALTITDADANQDGDSLDSVDVEVTSDSDPVGFSLSALETGENTGIFTLNIPTSSEFSAGSIFVSSGDDVFLEYNDEFPADYEDRADSVLDPSKDFTLVVPVGTSVSTNTSATTPTPPVPKDISGDELDEVTVGQQVVLSTTVNNNLNTETSYAAIIEVRDADGFTVSLQWATGTLDANGETEVGLSWTPQDAGEYTIRTFVLSSVDNPAALSLIEESTLTVS